MNIIQSIWKYLFPPPLYPSEASIFRQAIIIAKTLGSHGGSVYVNYNYTHEFEGVTITYKYDAPFDQDDPWLQDVAIEYGDHGTVFQMRKSVHKGNGCDVYRKGNWIGKLIDEGGKASKKLLAEQEHNFGEL